MTRQRSAYRVRWADGRAVQYYENQAHANQAAKVLDDAERPVYVTVPSGYRVQTRPPKRKDRK